MSSRTHGILDYITVLVLLISPTLLELQSSVATFTYGLAFIHLILTFFTNFEAGVIKLVSFKIHGTIEIVVSIALIGIAIWFRISHDNVSFYFYLIFSVVLFVLWVATDYMPTFHKTIEKDLKT